MVLNISTYLTQRGFNVRARRGGGKVKERYSAFYVMNIVFQSIFTLLWHIGSFL